MARTTTRLRAPQKGDYVLATKFEDGDVCDPWYVGFYKEYNEELKLHIVEGSERGYRRCELITKEQGVGILKAGAELEDIGLRLGQGLQLSWWNILLVEEDD